MRDSNKVAPITQQNEPKSISSKNYKKKNHDYSIPGLNDVVDNKIELKNELETPTPPTKKKTKSLKIPVPNAMYGKKSISFKEKTPKNKNKRKKTEMDDLQDLETVLNPFDTMKDQINQKMKMTKEVQSITGQSMPMFNAVQL